MTCINFNIAQFRLMNTDWVSSAQFTAPDSPLGKMKQRQQRQGCGMLVDQTSFFNLSRISINENWILHAISRIDCVFICDRKLTVLIDLILNWSPLFPSEWECFWSTALHCRFVSPVQLWELNHIDRSNTVDHAVRADGCSRHCGHDHSFDSCGHSTSLHRIFTVQTNVIECANGTVLMLLPDE